MSSEPLPSPGSQGPSALTRYGGGDRDPDAPHGCFAEAGLTLERIQLVEPGYRWAIARTTEAGRGEAQASRRLRLSSSGTQDAVSNSCVPCAARIS